MLHQPWQIEHFAASALRALSYKERITEQLIQQSRFNLAAGGPLAIAIEVVAALPVNPGIQQDVPRAAVKTRDRLAGFDQAEVTEPADVQHRAVTGLLFKQGFVKGWNQWGALSASGYVAAAEIADHGDAGQLGEQ